MRLERKFAGAMRAEGVLMRPLGDVIVVMPPLAIEPSLLDRIGIVLYNALNAIEE